MQKRRRKETGAKTNKIQTQNGSRCSLLLKNSLMTCIRKVLFFLNIDLLPGAWFLHDPKTTTHLHGQDRHCFLLNDEARPFGSLIIYPTIENNLGLSLGQKDERRKSAGLWFYCSKHKRQSRLKNSAFGFFFFLTPIPFEYV